MKINIAIPQAIKKESCPQSIFLNILQQTMPEHYLKFQLKTKKMKQCYSWCNCFLSKVSLLDHYKSPLNFSLGSSSVLYAVMIQENASNICLMQSAHLI